jgi:hypothetical protein
MQALGLTNSTGVRHMTVTTSHHAGTIGGPDGEISFSFIPEYSAVYLLASMPSDRRRAPIRIRLTDTAALRDVLEKLEGLMQAEAQRRAKLSDATRPALSEGIDTVQVHISGSVISIQRALYDQAAQLVGSGKTVIAVGLIAKSIGWLGMAGAREVARAIYDHQRSAGLRE